eukprot:TRINITY_DN10852_c0_g1_i1.p1 TRINITY_DN10852_c0_g1~~TRINITY_DN10852_c0_g1_i1.p1  ORF type:complete len:81 (+),score=19.74 TRINITY_DN10852_c0_g1_i1:160-402(+)
MKQLRASEADLEASRKQLADYAAKVESLTIKLKTSEVDLDAAHQEPSTPSEDIDKLTSNLKEYEDNLCKIEVECEKWPLV